MVHAGELEKENLFIIMDNKLYLLLLIHLGINK